MSTGKRLVLWRHGQTTWNLEHRYQGQTDVPLDETGKAQAQCAAKRLALMLPDAIISSDLARAQQTAAVLSALTGLEVSLEKNLRERFGGDWQGLTDDEIRERYPVDHAVWAPTNGEPSPVVADRVAIALTLVADAMEEGQVTVVVGHGGALRLGMERLLGPVTESGAVLGPLANCSWSVLELRDAHWHLLEYNSTSVPEQ